MPITFSCPHCGVVTNVGDEYAGQSGPCKNCGQKVTIPIPGGVAAPPSKSSSMGIVLAVVISGGFFLLVCGGILVALLLPAVQAAREAARRMQCSNNMKQIALALHNYHDVYGSFPPAYTVDEDGEPLHSWRTLILPFLEQSGVYDQIKLDEPWDSPHNSAFNGWSIAAYHCPSAGAPERGCCYMAIVGPGTMFPGKDTVALKDVVDGTANTIAIVEVEPTGTSWMEPVDLDLNKMKFRPNQGGGSGQQSTEISSHHPGGAMVAMADGAVRFISDSIDPATLENLITIADGQVVTPNW